METISFANTHGIVLTISHCLIIFTLPVYLYYQSRPWAFWLHSVCSYAGSVMIIAIIAYSNFLWGFSNSSGYSLAHGILGFIYLTIACLNCISGTMKLLDYFGIVYINDYKKRKIHIILGVLFMYIGIANVLGMYIYRGEKTAIGVTATVFALILGAQYTLLISSARHSSGLQVKRNTQVTKSQLRQRLGKESAYFIYQDSVYVAENGKFDFFHPGGNQLILKTHGREIDRFIHGMYGLEDQLNSYSVPHPKNTFQFLKEQPTYFIKQSDRITNHTFTLAECSKVCETDAQYFYFKNGQSRQPLKRIDQLGLYYTFYFEQSCKRLYTQVAFLEKEAQDKLPQKYRDFTVKEKDGVPALIKIYDQGKFTQKLIKMKVGEEITIEGPWGRGLQLETFGPGTYVIVAAGTGVFPFLDLFYMLLLGVPELKGFFFHVFLKFRGQTNFYFKKLINGLAASKPEQFSLFLELKSDEQRFCRKVLRLTEGRKDEVKRIYVCGPPGLNYEAPLLLSEQFSQSIIHMM